MTPAATTVSDDRLRAQDAFTTGSLGRFVWFLRARVRDAHAAGHPHAQQLQDSVEDAVNGILDYRDQAARTCDPHAIVPARARAHALWIGLQTAAAFWHDHPDHPDHPDHVPGPNTAFTNPAHYATGH